MTYRQVCKVNDNKIVITLPENFKGMKEVVVLVDDAVNSKSQKLELLKKASTDVLFLSDIEEIHKDFGSIEHETL